MAAFCVSFFPWMEALMPQHSRRRVSVRLGLPTYESAYRRWYAFALLATLFWWLAAAALYTHLRSRFGFPAAAQLDSPRTLLFIYSLYFLLLLLTPLWFGYLVAVAWLIRGLKAVVHLVARLGIVFALLVVGDVLFAVAIQFASLQGGSQPVLAFSEAFSLSTASILLLESPQSPIGSVALLRALESLMGAALLACLVALVLTLPAEHEKATSAPKLPDA